MSGAAYLTPVLDGVLNGALNSAPFKVFLRAVKSGRASHAYILAGADSAMLDAFARLSSSLYSHSAS